MIHPRASPLLVLSLIFLLGCVPQSSNAFHSLSSVTVAYSGVRGRFRIRIADQRSKVSPCLRMAAVTDDFFQRGSVNKGNAKSLSMTASQIPTTVTRKRITMEGEPSPLPSMTDEEWESHIRTSPEVDAIRKELIGRYARNGFDRRYATQQVEQFLLDPKQSVPFLEMRRFADESKRSVYGDDGLTGDLTLVLATIVMLLGTVGVHLLGVYTDHLNSI